MPKTKSPQKSPQPGVSIQSSGNLRIDKSKIAGGNIVETKTTTRIESRNSKEDKELNAALDEILNAIQQAPKSKQKKAREKVAAIREIAVSESKDRKGKGKASGKASGGARDEVLANLITDLVDLVPGAVTAVVSAFGTPLLGGIAGPVTDFVIKKIKKLTNR